jgi:GT2 family glycosyltransferase
MTVGGDVGAVIVHHRRPEIVIETVHAVLRAGIQPENVLVVDNSEDDDIAAGLQSAADGWHVVFTANRGYGAAVNAGLRSTERATPFTLVLTHEARCDANDLERMVRILRTHVDVAVVGPDELRQGEKLWSRGGLLSLRLRIPRHRMDSRPATADCTEVDWVDGAIALYRTDILRREPLREDFFLYMEETELHTRLRGLGWRVVTASGSKGHQSSEGMPAYWAVRNTLLFQAAHGTRLSRAFAPWYVLARTCAQVVVERRWREVAQAFLGLQAGRAAMRAAQRPARVARPR